MSEQPPDPDTAAEPAAAALASELPRVLEPEVMDTPEEVDEYDAMDHRAVNQAFVADFLQRHGPCRGGWILDLGAGTALIPIELCRADPAARVLAADLSNHMLERARLHIARNRLQDRVRAELVDAKSAPHPNAAFEAVFSNTILHHIPEPASLLLEMFRLVAPGGTLFLRDLARPRDESELQRLVQLHAGAESPRARQLFQASLRAALTVPEIARLLQTLQLPQPGQDPRVDLRMTSDRHWTLVWKRPA